MKRFHLHLVSDSTGETNTAVARACLVQFDPLTDSRLVRLERGGFDQRWLRFDHAGWR